MRDIVDIRLKRGTSREVQTREQLLRLLTTHDVSRWLHTREVLVEEGAIPHSHPTLTLNTRHLEQDDVLLATFIHEQLHWHLSNLPHAPLRQPKPVASAMDELRAAYPGLPITAPLGAGNERSTYLHLIVNYLECAAMREVLEEWRFEALTSFWLGDHYTALYRAVLEQPDVIAAIIDRHELAS